MGNQDSRVIYGRRDATVDGMHTRAATVQPSTANEEKRTIRATLVTETPVPMFDWRRDVMFDEVLLADGGSWRKHVVMLDSHDRYTGSRGVIGSVSDPEQIGDRWEGTLDFVRGDEDVDKIWMRVSQGHLKGVSAGYRYQMRDVTIVDPGQSVVVNGRTYRASDERELRLVRKWIGHEVSTTPIQADENSHVRGENKRPSAFEVETDFVVKPNSGTRENHQTDNRSSAVGYLAFLRSLGLSESASKREIEEFHRSLEGDDRKQADTLLAQETGTRSEQPAERSAPEPAPAPAPQSSNQPTLEAERERIQMIRALGEDGVSQELVDRAIDEGWSLSQVRREFVKVRRQRSEPAQTESSVRSAPAIHVNNSDGPSLRALQGALLLRNQAVGSLDSHIFGHRSAAPSLRKCKADWLVDFNRSLQGQAEQNDDYMRAADEAHQYAAMPLPEMCRHVLRLAGEPHSGYNYRDLVTRALGTWVATDLFTTNFQAELLVGYTTSSDTTQGWVKESDLANWQPAERIQKGLVSRLRRKARTAAPEMADDSVSKELIQVYTYSERFELTREDLLDDRFGSLEMAPEDMGVAAAELRPDLVYGTLLSNPNMADGNALFGDLSASGGIKNVTTSATFSVGSLDSARATMMTQKINGRLIQERADYWIVAESKRWTCAKILGSDEERDTTANTRFGVMNPARNAFQLVSEPRLDAGITYPYDDSAIAGAPTTHFLASRGGRRGIEVAYLRSDGRGPITEPYQLTEGRIGQGWTVEMVIGVKAIGRAGVHRLTG